MARRTQVLLIDDIDGSEATQTVTFGLDGVTYEIDLSDEHATALRESLQEWVSKARRVSGRRYAPRQRSTGNGRGETARIRTWAIEHGLQVSSRGRIPASVIEAYRDAMEEQDPAPAQPAA